MDIRKIDACVDGYIDRREIEMNDNKLVGHLVAGKIAAAVWGDKSFKRPIEEIRLREEISIESLNRKAYNSVQSLLKKYERRRMEKG